MPNEKFEVEGDFLTIGRTFAEYRRLFDLTAEDLAGRQILDCGGGAGAFTATADELAADVRSVDPMYGPTADALEGELYAAIEENVAGLREQREAFVWDFYGDVATRERYLRAAAERFLADYATHPGRYVQGGLPALPFESGAFDLALVSNLLFLYDDRLDRSFHVESVRELARVADEVRMFPLASLDRTHSEFVDPVVEACRGDGLNAECRQVPYEFQPGATEMLVVSAGG
jgi:hypothetical protein